MFPGSELHRAFLRHFERIRYQFPSLAMDESIIAPTPTSGVQVLVVPAPPKFAILFGVLGTFCAIVGIAISVLQFRHARRSQPKRQREVYELA
jgi:hypothetical protein